MQVQKILVSAAMGAAVYYVLCYIKPNEDYKTLYAGAGAATALYYYDPTLMGLIKPGASAS